MVAHSHHRPVAKTNRRHARRMRHTPTNAERAMWRLLRDRRLAGWKFCLQVPFQTFILDFVCFDQKVVIEIDGSQHMASLHDEKAGCHPEAARLLCLALLEQ
jgi:very-short-patch-repair endonuclease